MYVFYGRLGDYPDDICVEDSFPFEKLPNGFDGETFEEWAAYGWDTGSDGLLEAPMPAEFAIEEVYPNPFNPTATISVALPADAELRVAVYNVSGQLIDLLADGRAAAGHHSFTFDATGLASGIYLVQAETASQKVIRKMMLVK